MLSANDNGNQSLRALEPCSQVGVRDSVQPPEFPNSENVGICKLRVRVIFSNWVPISPLAHAIRIVLALRSEKQMVRPAAPRGIAVMQNAEVWQFSVGNRPRCLVRAGQSNLAVVPRHDGAVAISIHTARPNPARPEMRHVRGHGAILVHPRPESNQESLVESQVEHPFRARLARCTKFYQFALFAIRRFLSEVVGGQNSLGSTHAARQPVSPALGNVVELENSYRPVRAASQVVNVLRILRGRFSFFLHNSVQLICATLPGRQAAGAFPF